MKVTGTTAAVALTVALAVGAPQLRHAAAAEAGPGHTVLGGPSMQAQRPVTLITGDRVTLLGPGQVSIERARGRERVSFVTRSVRGHTQVIPVDALRFVESGRVDERLFDVTALLDYRYDDASRPDLPLIVMGRSAPAGAKSVRALRGLRAVTALAPRTGALWTSIKAAGLGKDAPQIFLDGWRMPSLDVSVPQIGAPAAWQAGYTGTGVTVAVVDSGIDATHPDLAGVVTAQRNFVEDEDGLDHAGHGTHVASTIAGTGSASGGRYRGVAPGARLVGAKVCTEAGCPDSAILAGMQWAVAEQHARIVNLSLGGGDTPGIDPLEQAIEDLTSQYGALFVVSAGNAGHDASVGSPGSADDALTVGAVGPDESLAGFSSRGPRLGDAALKPDITAPGVGIVAARSAESDGDGPYISHSGTSMAAPHVTGAAAILAQRRPDWGPRQLKAALMASAVPNPATGVFGQGAGRVDVPGAIAATVVANPPSVSFGRPAWPHSDDVPITKTVTYRNTGTADVTLALTVDAKQPAMFRIGAQTVTVPAGGTADVTITADTRGPGPDGLTGGYLVATGPNETTRTPFAIDREKESYTLTLTNLDKSGQPTGNFYTRIINLDTSEDYAVGFEPGGAAAIRLPKGRYFVHGSVFEGDEASANLIRPALELGSDQRLVIDASAARPVTVTIPRARAQQVHAEFYYGLTVPAGQFVFGTVAPTFAGITLGSLGPERFDGLVTKVGGQWAQARPDGTTGNSPYVYSLAWLDKGRAPSGFHRDVRDRDLAAVRSSYLAHAPGATGTKAATSAAPDLRFGATVPTRFATPFTRTEYFSTSGVTWTARFEESAGEKRLAASVTPGLVYRAGCSYRETWNKAVFGPGFPGGYDPAQAGWAVRAGDLLVVGVPLFSDSGGHGGASTATGRVVLRRDGQVAGDTELTEEPALFTVPAAAGRYRLEMTAERGSPFTLSTKVTGAWEFTSAHGDAEVVPLALAAVRFSPALDDRHTAPAGRRFAVPVSVQAQAGSGPAGRPLAVDVSYDDGRTWKRAELRAGPSGTEAILRHPAAAGFVSLRAKARDAAGNTVEQTIIRAYRIA